MNRTNPMNDSFVKGTTVIYQLVPSRFVTIKVAALITGLSEKAIHRKIERTVWAEGRHFRRADGRIFIDMKRYEEWVERGT